MIVSLIMYVVGFWFFGFFLLCGYSYVFAGIRWILKKGLEAIAVGLWSLFCLALYLAFVAMTYGSDMVPDEVQISALGTAIVFYGCGALLIFFPIRELKKKIAKHRQQTQEQHV